MKKRILYILFPFATSLFAITVEDTNVAMFMEKNKGAFAITSNVAISPQKPSSDKDITYTKYLNASLLLPSGLQFSFGNTLEQDDRYSYLGLSYYLKNKSYTIGMNFKSHYETGYERKPKEIGALFSYKIKEQAFTPYIRYIIRQYSINQNLQLLTLGGFASITQLFISFSYTIPTHSIPDIYNGKGEINLNFGVFLD